MVDQPPEEVEQEANSPIRARSSFGDRCFLARLGSSLRGDLNRRTMESGREESVTHKFLELMGGGTLAVKTFAKNLTDVHIHLRMDNITAISYINRMGGTRSYTLSEMACSLWSWCLKRGIFLLVEHLPGIYNATADMESRTLHSSAEWEHILGPISSQLGSCEVDLFATRLNHKSPLYKNWQPDPFAIATNTFHMSWTNVKGYAFPPFAVIGKCLQKVVQDMGHIILIAPVWPSQPWFLTMLDLLVHPPILFPEREDLLTGLFGELHPMCVQHTLQLAAWKFSGDRSTRMAFQAGLSSSSSLDGVEERMWYTSRHGIDGFIGVLRGKLIPYLVV